MSAPLHAWATCLDTLLDQVWTRLIRGVHDRRTASHNLTLATTSAKGLPECRTVVLRGADRDAGTLEIHTDRASAKVAALSLQPHAALHTWDNRVRLQIRLLSRASLHHGSEVESIWQRLGEKSRLAYGGHPTAGTPIDESDAYEKNPGFDAFVVVRLEIQSIDALHLGRPHRRARFDRNDNWTGQWLVP